MNKINLQEIVGGQLQAKFERSFEKVIENLQDPNTSFKVKRGITIVDHGSGSHQAYYSSAYNGGISYLSSNKIKIYNNGGITRLYAR